MPPYKLLKRRNMEVMGIAITLLGVILAYIWRSNGKLQISMMEAQRAMMEALLRIEEGQKDIAAAQKDIATAQKDIAQMLLNQTRILERIEAKIS